ncbi:hypothetical protein BGX38DRAFT_1145118 [Terfezia claveryi]|nr:hypothetical protein BGX38DRAFT_1145118 [Terfezia claveryi]
MSFRRQESMSFEQCRAPESVRYNMFREQLEEKLLNESHDIGIEVEKLREPENGVGEISEKRVRQNKAGNKIDIEVIEIDGAKVDNWGSEQVKMEVNEGKGDRNEFARIEREVREDWELDNRIAELVWPYLTELQMADYITEEAIRISLLGLHGISRWSAYASTELHTRYDELCMLWEKKRKREKRVADNCRKKAAAAIQAAKRWNMMQKELDEQVEETKWEKRNLRDTLVEVDLRKRGISSSVDEEEAS